MINFANKLLNLINFNIKRILYVCFLSILIIFPLNYSVDRFYLDSPGTFFIFIKHYLQSTTIFFIFNLSNHRRSQLCSSFPTQSTLNSLNSLLGNSIFVKYAHSFITLFSYLVSSYESIISLEKANSIQKILSHKKFYSRLNFYFNQLCTGNLNKAYRFQTSLQLIQCYYPLCL